MKNKNEKPRSYESDIKKIQDDQTALEGKADSLLEAAAMTQKNVKNLQDTFDNFRLRVALTRWRTATAVLLVPFIAFFIYVAVH